MTCLSCGKPTEHNFCDWSCHIALARREGGDTIAPNGLPITSIRADNTMLEHEHADHRTYLFPVEVDYVGVIDASDLVDCYEMTGKEDPDEDDAREMLCQVHALIYTDGFVAVTMYEHNYAMFLASGECLGGTLWERGEWQLSEVARAQILSQR